MTGGLQHLQHLCRVTVDCVMSVISHVPCNKAGRVPVT
jgi:hypothetical protein